MSKQTREEKRAEERRIIAEMETAMREKEEAKKAQTEQNETGEETPQTEQNAPSKSPKKEDKKKFHCPKCRTLLGDDGRCPTCGYKMYIPMDEKKRNKIKWIITVVAMVVFAVLFVILQFKK